MLEKELLLSMSPSKKRRRQSSAQSARSEGRSKDSRSTLQQQPGVRSSPRKQRQPTDILVQQDKSSNRSVKGIEEMEGSKRQKLAVNGVSAVSVGTRQTTGQNPAVAQNASNEKSEAISSQSKIAKPSAPLETATGQLAETTVKHTPTAGQPELKELAESAASAQLSVAMVSKQTASAIEQSSPASDDRRPEAGGTQVLAAAGSKQLEAACAQPSTASGEQLSTAPDSPAASVRMPVPVEKAAGNDPKPTARPNIQARKERGFFPTYYTYITVFIRNAASLTLLLLKGSKLRKGNKN
jgi:hypothetical protein